MTTTCFTSAVATRLFLASALFLALAPTPLRAQAPAVKPEPGLVVTHTVGDASHLAVAPGVSLHVAAGQPVSPFLPPGKFTATWEGFVNVDLRGDYAFAAELGGTVKVEANGAVVFEADAQKSEPSKPVRLNKGANAFKVTYTSPEAGDAWLRLKWIPRGSFAQPILDGQFTHTADQPSLAKSLAAAKGRGLIFEKRCIKCHTAGEAGQGSPELAYDAPTFEGIGGRRGQAWLAKWIADPKASRATARMPQMVHGPNAAQDAADLAAFLATLKSAEPAPKVKAASKELIEAGKELATKVHCAGCHSFPGGEQDPKRPALKHVQKKFPEGWLAAFLKQPDAHYAWSRMPNFHFTDDEAAAMAAWLNSDADALVDAPKGDATRGKQLVQTTGCLNCHTLKLENQFKARPLAELAAASWTKACVADQSDGKSPNFSLAADELAALQAFAATDRASLTRHSPAEYAQRQTAVLQCANCHGQLEGFPRLEILGGKLRPEWAGQFIAGQVKYKPRNWIEARMPGFQARGDLLAVGLAAMHGFPAKTPADAPVNAEEAKLGQKLVGSDGGFSCIACHAVGEFGATQVFESAGVNFAHTSERLLRSYFDRWLLNPTFIDPQTKMPVYFSDYPQSPLTDVHGGDALKQISALWEYMKLGSKMPPPQPTQ